MTSTQLVFDSAAAHAAWIDRQSALPQGFRVGSQQFDFVPVEVGTAAKMTVNVLALDQPTESFAAVFTRNAFPGAPVIIGRDRLKEAQLAAVVINNKISNVCAPDGVAASEQVCAAAASALGIEPEQVLPSSTGVIGWQLPVADLSNALPLAVQNMQAESIAPLASGIMTTDLYPKVRSIELGGGRIVGVAKGAGMIEPNLATMLVYLVTDITIDRVAIRRALQAAVSPSFNAMSIDSDQSTSDTVVVMSSNKINGVDEADFTAALTQVCRDLAEDLVRNGEGVRHVIEVSVTGAPDETVAREVGKAVVNSPLVKTAIAGNDANVGRIVMAIGDWLGNHRPDLSPAAATLHIGEHQVLADGVFQLNPKTEQALHQILLSAELYPSGQPNDSGVFEPALRYPPHEKVVPIILDLKLGDASATVVGADLTHHYVSENADYRS